MGSITPTVKHLLIINIIFYVATISIGDVVFQLFALYFPENELFHFWQIITSMFMHDPNGIMHILFNMFMLFMFGSFLEGVVGRNKFLFLYFSAGLGATGLHLLMAYFNYYPGYQTLLTSGVSQADIMAIMDTGMFNEELLKVVSKETLGNMYQAFNGSVVGASGAVFGLLAAFVLINPNMPMMIMFIPIPIKAKYLIGGYFALTVFSAITGIALAGPANTAFWAHIGGAVIGFITMWYWKKNSFNNRRWD